MNFESMCIHGAKDKTNATGAISVPIFQSATFGHPGVNQSTGYDYSRLQNPTREHLENIMKNLEGGIDALAFSTGMAAEATLFELFEIGDHIIATDDLYGGSIRLFDNISKKNGILIDRVDTSKINNIENKINKKTKAIFIETPTNPLMLVSDIKQISILAKKYHLILIVDNTFLTPYFLKPLSLGADIVVHSGTKYLCGHNDTLSGFLVAGDEKLAEKLRFIYKTTGACLSPFDSWLTIRGIKTLSLRMEKQQENAFLVSEFLNTHRKIAKVNYIGMPSHEQFEISKKQGTGFGAMISFVTDSNETAVKLLENVNMILYAESLGGVETLITYPMLQTHADLSEEERASRGIHDRLIRLSVGCENAEDIIADLENALR